MAVEYNTPGLAADPGDQTTEVVSDTPDCTEASLPGIS